MTSDTTTPSSDALRIGKVTCSSDAKGWLVSFPVDYRGKEQRRRKRFKDETSARAYSDVKEREIAEHGVRYGSVPAEVRRAYQTYCERKSKLSAKGIEVPDFETFMGNALDALGQEVILPELSVAEAVEQFLMEKRVTLAARSLHSLRNRLRQFARIMGDRSIRSIDTLQIEEWLLGLGRQRKKKGAFEKASNDGLSAHALNHYRAALASLFGHAVKNGWVAFNPVKALKRAVPLDEKPEIYTPEQAAAVMFAALDNQPSVLAVLALQMFAGLRLSDAAKTDLSVVLSQAAQQAGSFPTTFSKTPSRQLPICDALCSWLAVHPNPSGLAWEGSQDLLRNRLKEVLRYAGVQGNLESPRMTYLRYRLHLTGDVAHVAAEGSVRFALLESLSRIPVTAEATKCFFELNPTTPTGEMPSPGPFH
jgi:site-specific recombinase XerC